MAGFGIVLFIKEKTILVANRQKDLPPEHRNFFCMFQPVQISTNSFLKIFGLKQVIVFQQSFYYYIFLQQDHRFAITRLHILKITAKHLKAFIYENVVV